MVNSESEINLFFRAAKGDWIGVAKILDSGTSVNASDYNSRTALHLAAERGHVEVVKYLISSGAEVEAKDCYGKTAAEIAIDEHHKLVYDILENAACDSLKIISNDSIRAKRSMYAVFAVTEAFPRQIATAMIEGRKISPISRSAVSLLFSEVVGFEELSTKLCADKVFDLLDRLYRKFDKIALTHGVQKVDTFGKVFMAATNFMEDQATDHAARLARFACEALRAAGETLIDEHEPASRRIQLRIGMHCGPVTGNVIGSQNLKYTLLGDTVNIAARMQTTCTPGRIQCSAATAAALESQQAPDIALRARGDVDIKGKGTMRTSWVCSLRSAQTSRTRLPNPSPTPDGEAGGMHHSESCPDLQRPSRPAEPDTSQPDPTQRAPHLDDSDDELPARARDAGGAATAARRLWHWDSARSFASPLGTLEYQGKAPAGVPPSRCQCSESMPGPGVAGASA